MSFWKAREILTDVHDRYFPQFYDEETKNFKVQPKVAREETLKKMELLIESSTNYENKEVYEPPHLRNVRYLTTEARMVHWFHDGFFYGSNNDALLKSKDGINWTTVHNFGNHSDIAWVIVSDTNRFIVGFGLGHVYVGNEDGTFEETLTIVTGHLDVRWGHVKYNNVIAFNTYSAPKGIEEGKHEAFLSTDNGATFKKIFDNTTPATFSPLVDEDYHLHDIEYDPYSGRIYLWSGDFNNRLLQFSDDWGVTWKATAERGLMPNATQVIATKRGIALGSDTSPGGMGFIEIDRSKNVMAEPDIENYDNLHWYFSGLSERFLATRRWVDREKGIYLVGYTPEYSDTNSGFIAYSKDGYTWNIIHRTSQKGSYLGFRLVFYGNGLIVATHQKPDNVRETFVAEAALGR